MKTVLVTRGHRISTLDESVKINNIVTLHDSLAVGPSSLSHLEHSHVRRKFWNTVYSVRDGLVPAFPLAPDLDNSCLRRCSEKIRLIFFVSPDPNDALALFWLSKCLLDSNRELWLAQIGDLIEYSDVQQAESRAVFLQKSEVRELCNAWEFFSTGKLAELMECTQSLPCCELICGSLQLLISTLLPKLSDNDEIRLSLLDMLLLNAFADQEAHAAFEVVGQVWNKLPWIPELYLFWRLHSWTDNVLQCASGNIWNRRNYRVVAKGRACLDSKLLLYCTHPPSVQLGGATAYLARNHDAVVRINESVYCHCCTLGKNFKASRN